MNLYNKAPLPQTHTVPCRQGILPCHAADNYQSSAKKALMFELIFDILSPDVVGQFIVHPFKTHNELCEYLP